MIYLDAAATTLRKPPEVLEAVAQAMTRSGNPRRSGHAAARYADDTLLACREQAGEMFHLCPEHVVLTMNATHGLNLAIHTLVAPGASVVVSGFEHNAVMRPLAARNARVIVAGRTLFEPEQTLRSWRSALARHPAAAVCTHVSNVFGYVLPIREIAQLCARFRVPLIVDASQSAGVLPVSMAEWQCAFIAMPGHKGLYGPMGTGLLLCGMTPKPLLCGGTGTQSRAFHMPEDLPERAEAGTPNVPGAAGLTAGMRFVRSQPDIAAREHRLIERFCQQIPQARRFFHPEHQTGVLSVVSTGDCELAAEQLAQREIAVRAGLHCAPLAHESAGTLESGTIRLSPDVFTTEAEIDRAAAIWKAAVEI